ncbi:MAG: (d)CMP kinase [Synergistaceae bacterium]
MARLVAEKVGLPYLDTGAIYRAIAWWLDKKKIAPTDEKKILSVLKNFTISFEGLKIIVDNQDITKEIRTPRIDVLVSPYAALKGIRDELLFLQRDLSENGLVAEGRDMGTEVFPEADLKIFLTASAEERASRRYHERVKKGEEADYKEILKQINERDNYDMNRDVAPLRPALGSVVLDSTEMTKEEVVNAIVSLANELR